MEIRSIRFQFNKRLPAVLVIVLLPTSVLADDFFIPDSSKALNLEAENTSFIDSAFGMDNDDLVNAVANLRNNSMGTVQRQLNHQWLQMHSSSDQFKPVTGGKALNEIFKMGWKTYREQNKRAKQNRLLRYTDGHGKLGKSMDYDVRLRDDEFKFSFEYEF